MRLTLEDLLHRLGCATIMHQDDADPGCIYDKAERTAYTGAVRLGAENEDIVCEVCRFDPDERMNSLLTLRAAPDGRIWQVAGLTVTGRLVTTRMTTPQRWPDH